MRKFTVFLLSLFSAASWLLIAAGCSGPEIPADLVLYNGRVVTVDSAFTITSAVAVTGEWITAVCSDKEVLALAGPQTERIDLAGRMVVPGLIEAHAHPDGASLSELEGPLPNPRNLSALLDWLYSQAHSRPAGAWIVHPKLFATRLAELRPPTLAELDSVAPEHPVFLDGSFGGSINSAAMRASGITDKTDNPGLLRDPVTGKLNGKIRLSAFELLKTPPAPALSVQERAELLLKMLSLYNQVGFTSYTAGEVKPEAVELFRYIREHGPLTIRAYLNILVPFDFKQMTLEQIRSEVAKLPGPTGTGDQWLRFGALKTFADGGILTGTAYLREPWGPKAAEIFGVTDPGYRGIPRYTAEQFAPLVQAGAEAGWKMTAHATGGGAVDGILEAYEQANKALPVAPLRFSIIHGNFFDRRAIERCAALGVIADAQPAWFYKDADAMLDILGPERIRTFHPYRSLIDAGVVISAGSDHMVIADNLESINPYNPWLGLWVMLTHRTERGTVVEPEEAITREQALRCYTINNAYASFEEKLKGSIEPGKLADLVVIDRDYLACPLDQVREIKVLMTVVGGRQVWRSAGI